MDRMAARPPQSYLRAGDGVHRGGRQAKPGEEHERYAMHAFGAQFAEVRVDADLGVLRVSRLSAHSTPAAS